MRNRLFAVALAGVLIVAACSDQRDSSPTGPRVPLQASVTPGTCTTLDNLKSEAAAIFGPGSPDYNSVRGKLDNLQHQIDIGNYADAKTKALDIIAFVKAKWEAGGLPGSKDQVDQFVLDVLCFAGYDIAGGDVVIVTASSTQSVGGTNDNHDAGFQAPPGGFNVPDGTPVVITIGEIPNGLLKNTKLDQYPGVFNFASTADITTGTKIVIGVCVTGVLPEAAVLNRLRLGHNPDENSFEITEAADPPPGLNCPTSSAMRGVPRWLAAIGRLLAPKSLQAASLATGGVGGSAGKLSPFAPIDPTLSATGGTGGSAGKLSPMSNLKIDGQTVNNTGCNFPAGGAVDEECRPQVTITTHNGTVLSNVPVLYEIGSGGGRVAPESACSAGGSSVTINTDGNGFSRACWTLGNTFGQQKVWVTPSFGGDAPEGVNFQPANLTFFANAVPEGLTTFMCELGAPDGDNNFLTFGTTNTGKVNVGWLRVKEPANKNTVDVAFYMSVTGQSSAFQNYPAEMKVYRTTGAAPASTASPVGSATGVSVGLPGNNGNPAFQEIRLTSPVIGDAGTGNYLWFALTMPGAPSNRTFQYWQTSKNAAAACSNASAISLDLKKTTAAPAIRLKN